MNISKFMDANFTEIERIISELGYTFNSHEFIERFAHQFESEYINFLSQFGCKGAFQNVHAQIGLYLSENSSRLNITKTRKVKNKNVFGLTDEIQEWSKKS